MTRPHHEGSNPAVVYGVNVDAVAAAVLACPGVARMSRGLLGEAATYLPGRRVHGVVIREQPSQDETDLDVRVVAAFGPTMADIAAQIRQAVASAAPGKSATVAIDDIDLGPSAGAFVRPHPSAPTATSAS